MIGFVQHNVYVNMILLQTTEREKEREREREPSVGKIRSIRYGCEHTRRQLSINHSHSHETYNYKVCTFLSFDA